MENKKKSSANLVKKRAYLKEEDRLVEKYGVMEVKIVGRSVTFKCKSEQELKELLAKLG